MALRAFAFLKVHKFILCTSLNFSSAYGCTVLRNVGGTFKRPDLQLLVMRRSCNVHW